ncbi:hypothetical protein KAW18_06975 [candidate division WOR-3 bacterium]|nr:hypothetical protein [candidate division WOR-3 bacterium]
MDNLLDRVIGQFDTLIPFLAISREDVFNLINRERNIWFSQDQRTALPGSYAIYRMQITHSAFLLGYSYFEAFLVDLVRQVYLSRPTMLPKEKQLKYGEILKTTDYEDILELMIEREIIDLFYKRMDEVIKYFEEKLKLEWLDNYKAKTIVTSHLRNCIIHNLNRADHRLSQISEYNVGDEIELSPSDVHSFGLKARELVRHLYNQTSKKHFKSNSG